VIYIEMAKFGSSKCVKCGDSIKRFDMRMRLRFTWRWGFMLCSKCVDEIVDEWRKTN
jgi:hypothetical protein